MKVVKGIFFSIIFIIMAGCMGILVCAFNPSLTAMLAEQVEGLSPARTEGAGGSQDTSGGTGEGENPPGIGSWIQAVTGGTQDEAQDADVRPGVNTGWMEDGSGIGYEIPGGQPGDIPDSVNGRNGYESVKEEAEQIAEDEAEDISGSIAPGETGSGLSFQEEYYPYYAMLEEDMKQMYRQIYANALNLTQSFAPVGTISVSQLKTVFEAVFNDHPELFWLESGYSCKHLRDGRCVEIILKYNDTVDGLDEARRNFEGAAEKILSGARNLGGDYEKEKYVHDVLMEAVEYDAGSAMNQSAYSALVGGRSVCAGYARAFQYLMQQLGIPCYYCTGYAGEDHAWNIIKLDGEFRNVDVTWDDTDTPTYDYFNKTDREFADTHRRTGLSVYLPACMAGGGGEEGADGLRGGTVSGNDAAAGWDVSITDILDKFNPDSVELPSVEEDGDSESAGSDGDLSEEDEEQANLDKAGVTREQVRETMEEYYVDCLALLQEVGLGDKQFSVVVPESLWAELEQAYNSGAYREGYVEDALEALGAEYFVIQLQVERLGGGYYRLYHNVYTY